MAGNISEPTQMLSTLIGPPEGAGVRLKLVENQNFSSSDLVPPTTVDGIKNRAKVFCSNFMSFHPFELIFIG